MKKITFLVSALVLTSSVFAQDLTSKKGENYLPEQGDWAIGINAMPFLNYVGNFFGKSNFSNDGGATTTGNQAPTWDFATTNQTIVGKYFMEEKMAIRGALRIGFGSKTATAVVADRGADNTFLSYPNKMPTKNNEMKSSFNNIGLSGGLEWRKGNTRLQGFYGGELGFMVSGMKNTYDYGNKLTANTPEPQNVSVDADDEFFDANGNGVNMNHTDDSGANPGRDLNSKSSSFGFGLRGFIGAEYFIIPKLSIGGEFGWGLGFTSTNGSYEVESVGNDLGGNQVVGKQTFDDTKTSGFSLDTQTNNTLFGAAGQLNIIFHF